MNIIIFKNTQAVLICERRRIENHTNVTINLTCQTQLKIVSITIKSIKYHVTNAELQPLSIYLIVAHYQHLIIKIKNLVRRKMPNMCENTRPI